MSTPIETSLISILREDTTLMALVDGVYNLFAPVGAPFPHIIIHSLGGPDDYTLTQRIRTSYLYHIRVLDKSQTLTKINSAVARIDVLLNDVEVVTGATLYCRRVGLIPNHPMLDEDGNLLLQGGASYSIQVR